MNLRYLQYLRWVVEHGSFDAAALAGGVTQPAISHGMKQLQREFDSPLFVRSGRTLRPTETALRLACKSMDLAARVDELIDASVTRSGRENLRVGVTPSAALVCGPALHLAWCQGHSRRRLVMSSADEGRMLADLQGGELDLVISPRPRKYRAAGVVSQPLYQLTPMVYARRTHPLIAARSLEELLGAPWAVVGPSVSGPVNLLREAISVRRMRMPLVAASCPDYASLIHLMTYGDLLGVLPHRALLGDVKRSPLVPLDLQEAFPRYEMHLFSAKGSGRVPGDVIEVLLQQLARTSEEQVHGRKSRP